jgi:hypothetical protein
MIAPNPLHLTQNSCLGVCRTVSLLHESRCKTGRTGAIITQVLYRKSRQNFSQRTHPIHSIWPKTHVFGHFGPFRYCTKVDAKLAEQVPITHKFTKGIWFKRFRNERTGSTPFDPKLVFWAVLLLHESRCKLAELVLLTHKFTKQGRVIIFRNERARSIPLDPKLMF